MFSIVVACIHTNALHPISFCCWCCWLLDEYRGSCWKTMWLPTLVAFIACICHASQLFTTLLPSLPSFAIQICTNTNTCTQTHIHVYIDFRSFCVPSPIPDSFAYHRDNYIWKFVAKLFESINFSHSIEVHSVNWFVVLRWISLYCSARGEVWALTNGWKSHEHNTLRYNLSKH